MMPNSVTILMLDKCIICGRELKGNYYTVPLTLKNGGLLVVGLCEEHGKVISFKQIKDNAWERLKELFGRETGEKKEQLTVAGLSCEEDPFLKGFCKIDLGLIEVYVNPSNKIFTVWIGDYYDCLDREDYKNLTNIIRELESMGYKYEYIKLGSKSSEG